MGRRRKKRNANKSGFWVVISCLIIIGIIAGLESEETSSSHTQKQQIKISTIGEYNKIYQKWGANIVNQEGLANNLNTKNYYVILDTSGSMAAKDCSQSHSKMDVAKDSLASWVTHVSSEDNIALMVFNDQVANEVFPLRQNSPNFKNQFLEKVRTAAAHGSTPLGDALLKAYTHLEYQSASQLGYGEYHIIVVTDGQASDSEVMDVAVLNIFKSPIVLHTIGFCIGTDHALNIPGQSFYMSAMNKEQLDKGLIRVLAESESFDVKGFVN
jgi:uncharacterized protein YegL